MMIWGENRGTCCSLHPHGMTCTDLLLLLGTSSMPGLVQEVRGVVLGHRGQTAMDGLEAVTPLILTNPL